MSDIRHIKELKPDRKNARRHNPRNIGMIEKALNEVGAARSIVIDEDGNILAGNGTIEAAAAAGIERVQVVDADGETIIAVRRSGLTAEQKQRLALFDNRAAELADWDTTVLADMLAADSAALDGMFAEDELDALLADVAGADEPTGDDPGAQVDKAAELQAKWGTALGQIWQLGDHRLACGDCRDVALVERLMGGEKLRMVWTDPPYGVSYADKNRFLNALGRPNSVEKPIDNDHMSEADTEELTRAALATAGEFSVPGASCYVACPPGTLLPHFIAAVAGAGFQYKHSLVWVKNQFVLGRCDYHYRHEIILYGWRDGAHYFVDDHTKDSVFEIDKPRNSDYHPTMKPVELVEPMIQNSSRPGEIVYEPFSGSGTTLIACERLGRRCRAVELDPGYVAVALQRWAEMSGKVPMLVEA